MENFRKNCEKDTPFFQKSPKLLKKKNEKLKSQKLLKKENVKKSVKKSGWSVCPVNTVYEDSYSRSFKMQKIYIYIKLS